MKKFAMFSFALLFALAVGQVQAQDTKGEPKKEIRKEKKMERVALRKLEGKTVSQISKNSFNADFGKIPDVKWERLETFDKATFTKDGHEMSAYYDPDGKLVGTTSIKTEDYLPAKGLKNLLKKYPGYTIGQILFFNDNEANETDMMLYGIQFEDADNYFVELSKGNKTIVVQVTAEGNIFFFKQL
ncbi:MAG: hypothetical protein Q8908_16910 [Bacteroidota bacterium]|nr:hypothetical protein [Bacteroidota bacterium]